MDKGRTGAFSDGVLAVAITLLVLDLRVEPTGHGSLLHQLGQTYPAYAAYVVSFVVIGVIWVNHHAWFSLLAHRPRAHVRESPAAHVRDDAAVHHIDLGRVHPRRRRERALGRRALRHLQRRDGVRVHRDARPHGAARLLRRPVTPETGKAAVRRFDLGTIAYPIATIAGLAWPPLILLAIAALAIYYTVEHIQILPDTDDQHSDRRS